MPIVPGCASDSPESQAGQVVFSLLPVGETVPAYRVLSSDSTMIEVTSDQSITLLNLWAPWCAPCIEEFPDIEQLHKAYEDKGLRVLAVDVDPDPLSTVQKFAVDHSLSFLIAKDHAGSIQQEYKAIGVPSSYLIDSDGTLLEQWVGMLPKDVDKTIEHYLNQL